MIYSKKLNIMIVIYCLCENKWFKLLWEYNMIDIANLNTLLWQHNIIDIANLDALLAI